MIVRQCDLLPPAWADFQVWLCARIDLSEEDIDELVAHANMKMLHVSDSIECSASNFCSQFRVAVASTETDPEALFVVHQAKKFKKAVQKLTG